jgi:hypothetical protein
MILLDDIAMTQQHYTLLQWQLAPCLIMICVYKLSFPVNTAMTHHKLCTLHSGNWMWASKLPGECARMYDACSALREALLACGVGIDGGKVRLHNIWQKSCHSYTCAVTRLSVLCLEACCTVLSCMHALVCMLKCSTATSSAATMYTETMYFTETCCAFTSTYRSLWTAMSCCLVLHVVCFAMDCCCRTRCLWQHGAAVSWSSHQAH